MSRSPKIKHESLEHELEEARDALRAIQGGEVDALVVHGEHGDQIYTIKSAERPYRILVEAMNEGAVTLDANGTIFYCNLRFSEMVHRPIESLIGTMIQTLFYANDRQIFTDLFERALKNKSKGLLSLKVGDGQLLPAMFSMSAVDVEGLSGVCLVVTDLTIQHNLEESRVDIEKMNVQRNLRELFVSTLSHDLRNPLSAARLSADLIVRHPEEHEKHLVHGARIIKNIERADKMIQDLLDANRIQAGEKLPLEMSECDLKETTEETLEELSMAHGDHFVLKADRQVTGYWSGRHLRRAIENLASNAIKYGTPDTPVTVILKKNAHETSISVHNQGNPLSTEEQLTIFKPFTRTKQAHGAGQRGWGLGLTLVRGVAEAHGGHVGVESSAGAGTTFKITLPNDSRPFQNT